jgi:hypothetical protein
VLADGLGGGVDRRRSSRLLGIRHEGPGGRVLFEETLGESLEIGRAIEDALVRPRFDLDVAEPRSFEQSPRLVGVGERERAGVPGWGGGGRSR